MNLKQVITSQYLAALEMLRQAVLKCPPALWDDPADKSRFWHVAYHALFYTHLYLQDTEAAFVPWAKHRDQYQYMGPLPWPPHAMPAIGQAYTPGEILDYLDFCRHEVATRVPRADLEAASGFYWLPFGKLELQLYTIRHIQQHAGELMERLGSRAGIEVAWVGRQAA